MVNLMKLKDGIGLMEFGAEFAQIIGPMLSELGAEPIFTGLAGPEFCAEDDWGLVALVT